MGLDVRLPLGLLLVSVGAVLVIYGVAADPAIYARSLGVNINALWGVVLMAVGGAALGLAVRSKGGP